MDGRMTSQYGSGVFQAAAGVDDTVFVLNAVHRESADRGQTERAVRLNRADHCTECIDVGADPDGPRRIKAGHTENHAPFFVPGERNIQRRRFFSYKTHDLCGKTAGAWSIKQLFEKG
ncbi:hypothetical protein D3C73_1304390 [compost metagenome]